MNTTTTPALQTRLRGYSQYSAYKFASYFGGLTNGHIYESMQDEGQPVMRITDHNGQQVVRFADGSAVSFGYQSGNDQTPSLIVHHDGNADAYPLCEDVLTFPTLFRGITQRLAEAFTRQLANEGKPHTIHFDSFVGNGDDSVTLTFTTDQPHTSYSLTVAATDQPFDFEKAVTDFICRDRVEATTGDERFVINKLPMIRFNTAHYFGWLLYKMAGQSAVVVEYCAGAVTDEPKPIEVSLTTIVRQVVGRNVPVLILDDSRYHA